MTGRRTMAPGRRRTHVLTVHEDGTAEVAHFGCYNNLQLCNMTWAYPEASPWPEPGRWFVQFNSRQTFPAGSDGPAEYEYQVTVTGKAS